MSDHESRINELGITVTSEFVPLSKSRNAQAGRPTINWRTTVHFRGASFTTDFQQGVGFIPGYNKLARTIVTLDAETQACETGRYMPARFVGRGACPTIPLPHPLATYVLYCLIHDASVLDYAGFEDWAGDYGYDMDSRIGFAIYQECIVTALKLRNLLGYTVMQELRDILSDY